MKIIKYIRVSTSEQNTDRQEQTDVLTFVDKCSGTIPFSKREQGSRLIKMATTGTLNELRVHSIDRLGRSTLDVLNTIQTLTDLSVNVVSEKEGLSTLLDNGNVNPVSKLIINILASVAEMELNLNKERQREGIAIAQAQGRYKANGGKPKETDEQFLNKAKNAICAKELRNGNSIRRSANLSGVSTTTAVKVNKLLNL
jgi:DNA invertase Pin-like site-specific DNA recombinase